MERLVVDSFMNNGLVPAVECVRCPSCKHEMPMDSAEVIGDACNCRCGLSFDIKRLDAEKASKPVVESEPSA